MTKEKKKLINLWPRNKKNSSNLQDNRGWLKQMRFDES